jgi:hypothetical protein
VNEPIQEEESGDAMLEQGTQVRSSVPINLFFRKLYLQNAMQN